MTPVSEVADDAWRPGADRVATPLERNAEYLGRGLYLNGDGCEDLFLMALGRVGLAVNERPDVYRGSKTIAASTEVSRVHGLGMPGGAS